MACPNREAPGRPPQAFEPEEPPGAFKSNPPSWFRRVEAHPVQAMWEGSPVPPPAHLGGGHWLTWMFPASMSTKKAGASPASG